MWRHLARAAIAIAIAVGILASLGGTAAQAYPPITEQAAAVCLTRSSTVSSPGTWRFISAEGWWRIGPLHASPGCGGYVRFMSDGWRFDATQCGQIWGRRPAPDGSTYIVPGSVKHVCGGDSIVVLSRCRCQTFWLEAWPYAASDRRSTIWPLGVVFF